MSTLTAKLFPPRPNLPDDVTTIDVLKTVALGLMVIDHIGWLIIPEVEWFRVLGRLCVPLWFFLIGYADTRDIPKRWLYAGILLLISNLAVGLPPLPLSVLFTMALTRLCLDPFWRAVERRPVYFWWFVLLLIFVSYATNMGVEYGTMGFLLACCGFAVRHREDVNEVFAQTTPHRTVPEVLMIVTFLAYGLLQSMIFGFSMLGVMVVLAGLIGEYFVLQHFTVRTLPGTSSKPSAPMIKFFGRYTLELYVIHLLVLKCVFGLHQLAVYLIR